jgi:alkaline phosphatase D
MKKTVSRRKFLSGSLAAMTATRALTNLPTLAAAQDAQGSRQATGVKVGEVTDSSAIVWMRVTAQAGPNAKGKDFPRGQPIHLPKGIRVEELRGACPGAAGRVRLRYSTRADLANAKTTAWADVTAQSDFSRQFRLAALAADTVYHYAAETTGPGGQPVHAPLRGSFQTAPAPDRFADVVFTAISCSAFRDLDHDDGFHIFPAMAALRPRFYVHTGDNVYYDSDIVLASGVELARWHWHRMHSLPRHVAFHLQVPGYFEKDDHDCLQDDCWPGGKNDRVAPLTFAQGLAIFREQVPMGERTYRTFRWGRGLQIWLVEIRDFRSPNTMKDGPDKTIWGPVQKEWLFETLRASDAEFKILISPTPIVGPDRANKRDNHANAAFAHEGNELRRWFQKHMPERFFWINGDRHWQYHSVHPETGLHEFCTGATSDAHASGTPGEDKKVHRFHRVRGGFLSVAYQRVEQRGRVTVRHHDVAGKVVYEHRFGN